MKFLIASLLAICVVKCSAQNMSFFDLILLKKSSLSNATQSIDKKHYEFFKADGRDEGGYVCFKYNGTEDHDFYTQAYVYLTKKKGADELSKVAISLFTKDKYNAFMSTSKDYGYILMKTDIKDDDLIYIYSNGQYELKVDISSDIDSQGRKLAHYFIALYDPV